MSQEIIDKALAIAALLEIRAPDETASADDWRVWVAWWEASYEAARGLSEEQKRYLKAGGWWPPVTATHTRPKSSSGRSGQVSFEVHNSRCAAEQT